MSSLHTNLELGRERLALGDYPGALAHADAAIALDATSFEALQLRSRALYLLGRDNEALQTLRQAHRVLQQHYSATPDSDPYDEMPEASEEEMPESPPFGTDALETLLALRGRHVLDADLLALLAELAEDAGRNEIARDAYAALVEAEPDLVDAWEGLVHVLCHEDLDAALEAIARAQTRFPTHALFFEFLGFIRYRRRQFREAIAAYRRAIELGADDPENPEALVEAHLELGEQETALALLRTLAEQGEQDAETHRFIIEVSLQCEQPELALEHAHQLMRLQPSHAETYCYKAWVELAYGDRAGAERTLRLGYHKAADGAFSLFELVDILIAEGNLDDALHVAELSIELAPDHPESSASRGKILREMGLLDEALAAFKQSTLLAPQDDAYQTWIGVVYDNLGDYPSALRQFNHVLSRHPTDVWTLSNRGLTRLAMEQFDRALSDFNRGIDIDPYDAMLYFWRACAQVRLERIDSAFRDLQRALDLSDEIYSWLEQEPLLLPLRPDPRFRALLQPSGDEG